MNKQGILYNTSYKQYKYTYKHMYANTPTVLLLIAIENSRTAM